jgi:hypothetical protein
MRICRTLSKRVLWFDHEPIARVSGWLYFVIEDAWGFVQYVAVKGSTRRRSWWANRLLTSLTDANRVTEVI